MKKPRTFTDLINDPRVSNYSDERFGGNDNDGLWLYLKPGWICTSSDTNCVHEWTVADCCDALHESQYNPEWYYDSTYAVDEARLLLPAG